MDWDVQCGDCGAHLQLSPEGDVASTPCPECGGKRFYRSQPSPTQSDGTLRNMVDSDSQKDQGGNPLGEGTIMGIDGENGRGFRDNYMHGKVASPTLYTIAELRKSLPQHLQREVDSILIHEGANAALQFLQQIAPQQPFRGAPNEAYEMLGSQKAPNNVSTVSKSVEMRTLSMEPYAPLWDESYITKQAGPLAELAAPLVGAAGSLVSRLPLMYGIGHLMNGVFGGGDSGGDGNSAQSQMPDQAPSLQQLSSTDIPMLLLAAMDTPHSVPSVDEQHDDPEQQDQKEFNDGDDSPSNLKNPNNEDSGADGEDGVRDATPGYGFGENSPALERAMMILPLLLHYFESEESGESDPLIKGLHEALERENPGYLKQEHPDGPQSVQLLIQKHRGGPHTGGANAFPSGLADTPTPGTGMGGNICPNCGGVLAGDGSCPQCGAKTHPQGGADLSANPASLQNATLPPNYSNKQGPVNQEQKDALHQAIDTRPELFGDILDQIQHEPNTAPLVDPSQMTPPAPMPGMMNPSGSMPVNDPTQAGGGQPMQPMASKSADANNAVPRCPHCHSATTSVVGLGDNTGDGSANSMGHCHSCQKDFPIHNKEASYRIALVDVPNPLLQNAAEQHEVRPEGGQDSSLTWKDANGAPIEEGRTYSLYAPGYDIPDEVQVISKKPDQLGLKLVGEFSNQGAGPNEPDFTIDPQQVSLQQYSFVPSGQGDENQTANEQPLGGMPGLEQIPQSGDTTDEASNSYPNRGTVSQVLASDAMESEQYDDLCHKCGGDWIDHVASSSNTTMHECARCGSTWETHDDYEGREAKTDLSYILEDAQDDGFFGQMDRARMMRETQGGGSRNLSNVAAKDFRLQAVREVLDHNKQQRTAGRHFTPSEQRALINEKGKARNLDLLEIEDTHYVTRYDSTGKANPYNVPDEHLIFAL